MHKNTFTVIISIVVLGVAIFFGAYMLREQKQVLPEKINSTSSPSPAGTIDLSASAIAKWSVCRNEKYGYEFKYPAGWYVYGSYSRNPPQVINATLCERGMIIRISPTEPNTRYDPTKQEFSIMAEDHADLLAGGPCESVRSCRERALKITPSILPIEKETIVDGEKVLWTGDVKNNMSGMTAQFFHRGTLFTSGSEVLGYQFHNAILSTFKFIKQ